VSGEGREKPLAATHAYIIASPDAEARERKALELACGLLCEGAGANSCGECPACRLVRGGLHPDVIGIARRSDDKGKLRREIQVAQIREMAADAYVRPVQAEKKVYIIRDAGTMNVAAQNAALKILEEPPEYAVFLLCTESAEALLPTVRSRCVELRPGGEQTKAESAFAEEYLVLAAKKDEAGLCLFFGKHENLDAEQLGVFVGGVRFALNAFLCRRRNCAGLTREDAFHLLRLCEKADAYLRLNVGAKHILGLFCVA
jgi:hypothetical protein